MSGNPLRYGNGGHDDSAASAICLNDASYVLGGLSPTERQTYEQHLAGCVRCQASVARLAGLPGLLSSTSPDDLGIAVAPLPDTLLPRLLATVARERRRRRLLWSTTAGAAVAAVLALLVVLLVRPASTAPPVALPAPVAMKPLVSGPMQVSLQLTDKQWGTSVVVNCAYGSEHESGVGYQLVAFDPAGKPQTLGWWKSVAGSGTTVTTASSLRLKDIARLEVQLPDGRPILSATPAAK